MFILERENSYSPIIAGANSSLMCSASLPESLNLSVSIFWVKDEVQLKNSSETVMIDAPLRNTSMLEFQPVKTSSGGIYGCILSVNASINISLGQINITVTSK